MLTQDTVDMLTGRSLLIQDAFGFLTAQAQINAHLGCCGQGNRSDRLSIIKGNYY